MSFIKIKFLQERPVFKNEMNAVLDKTSAMITGLEKEDKEDPRPETSSATKRGIEMKEKQDEPPQTRSASKRACEIQENQDNHPQTSSGGKKSRFIANDLQTHKTKLRSGVQNKLQSVRSTRFAAKKARANIVNQIIEMKDCVVIVEKMNM